jgi:hypothetical protein
VAAASAGAFLRGVALGEQTATDSLALAPLIETILPIGDDGFPPISGEQLALRTDQLFRLGESPAFGASFASFSQLANFTSSSTVLDGAERAASPASDVSAAMALDTAAFERSNLPSHAVFASLEPSERSRYVVLWSRSAFSVRRRFHQSMRFVTFAACYSLPQAWKAIGYAGPLIGERR